MAASSVLSNSIALYISVFAIAVIIKSVYDSAAIESHLSDLEDQIKILHRDWDPRYRLSPRPLRFHRPYKYPRTFFHPIRSVRARQRHRYKTIRRSMAKESRRRTGMYGRSHDRSEPSAEIQMEPLHRRRAKISSSSPCFNASGPRASPFTIPTQPQRSQAGDSSVFVFPYGEARSDPRSSAFDPGHSYGSRSTLLS